MRTVRLLGLAVTLYAIAGIYLALRRRSTTITRRTYLLALAAGVLLAAAWVALIWTNP